MVQSTISRADFEWEEGNRKRGPGSSAFHGGSDCTGEDLRKKEEGFS